MKRPPPFLLKFIRISFLVVFLAFPSCSRHKVATSLRSNNLKTYSGSLKPKDSVGYIASSSSNLMIAEIDGRTIQQIKIRAKHDGSFSYVELLPGEHIIIVSGSTFHTSSQGFHTNLTVDRSSVTQTTGGRSELSFVVEPGHVYVIKTKITKSKDKENENQSISILKIYIKDVLTGKIVCQVDSEIRRI